MELDLAERDPPVLDYARFYGLCEDYASEQPCLQSIRGPSDDDLEAVLKDPLNDSLTNPSAELTKERLAVSKDAALLLKDVFSMGEPSTETSLARENWKRGSKLKQEVPILRSDDELDLLYFGSTDVPDFSDLRVSLENVDEEGDEGMQWPSKYYDYPNLCEERAKTEKLVVSKDDLIYLQNAVRDSWTPEDSDKIEQESLTCRRRDKALKASPPLLPLSPPMTPYVPSSPGNRLNLLSEDTDSTAAELKALDERIMKDDALVHPLHPEGSDDSMLLDDFSAITLNSLQEFSEKPSSPVLKRKARDLKVEGPLTPPILSESPIKKLKSVTFPKKIHELIPIPDISSTLGSGDDILNSQDSFAGFFKPYAEQVNKSLENEKLSGADTTKRVDVPEVDFTPPIPPWVEFSQKSRRVPTGETELDAQMKFLLSVKRNVLKVTSSWHGSAKLDRDLHWSPFLKLGTTVTIDETLHGEEVLNTILADLTDGDIATSSTDMWKRDGMRILEEDEDSEEELEVANFEEPNSIDSIIRKRKLELGSDEGKDPYASSELRGKRAAESTYNDGVEETNNQERSQASSSRRKRSNEKFAATSKDDNSLMFGGLFSATVALNKFMEVHGKVPMDAAPGGDKISTHFKPVRPIDPRLPIRPTNAQPESTSLEVAPGIHSAEAHRPPSAVPSLPSVPENLPPCSFIISSTLLQQRNLAREVENLYAGAEFVERDFSLPHSPAKEADLLLSPSTGLIFTTLQQLKQGALPGQPNRSPIKERLLQLQTRYERLIVLISEGLSREAEQSGHSRPVDKRDEEALKEFEMFTAVMEAEVLHHFVRGGEMCLARTIVNKMATYGLPHGSQDIGDLRILQDETNWEVFLRRVGLDPFAAQIILATLKDVLDVPVVLSSSSRSNAVDQTVRVSGLPHFVIMGTEERIERFQVLLGGSRILRRVNAVLNQTWPSAAHNFEI